MIVALIILIGLSAFFSAAETAYNSLNEIRLRSKAEDGDAKAAHTLALVERYDSLLSTILIGNNMSISVRPLLPPCCLPALSARLRPYRLDDCHDPAGLGLWRNHPQEHGQGNARNNGHGLCPRAQCAGHDFYAAERLVRCVEKSSLPNGLIPEKRTPSPRVS